MTEEEEVRKLQEDSGKGTKEEDKSNKGKEVITEYLHRGIMRRRT